MPAADASGGGFDPLGFWALGIGISFTNLDTRAIVIV